MLQLQISHVTDPADRLPDLPHVRQTINLPDLPDDVKSWQDLLEWLRNNPDFIAMIIAAILALLGGITPPPEKH